MVDPQQCRPHVRATPYPTLDGVHRTRARCGRSAFGISTGPVQIRTSSSGTRGAMPPLNALVCNLEHSPFVLVMHLGRTRTSQACHNRWITALDQHLRLGQPSATGSSLLCWTTPFGSLCSRSCVMLGLSTSTTQPWRSTWVRMMPESGRGRDRKKYGYLRKNKDM